jgi:hypothetical protein
MTAWAFGISSMYQDAEVCLNCRLAADACYRDVRCPYARKAVKVKANIINGFSFENIVRKAVASCADAYHRDVHYLYVRKAIQVKANIINGFNLENIVRKAMASCRNS